MKENNNVENLNEETQNPHVVNNSTEQENEAQSATGTSPEESTNPETETKEEESKSSKNDKKTKKDYKPVYSEEEEAKLREITKVCKEEITRVINDKRYHGTPVNDGTNFYFDLDKIYKEGLIDFATPLINRIHGGDQDKTGKSIMTYGAQHILIAMTVKMAKAAGILATRFATDQKTGKLIPDDAIIFMDGNGRICFLHDIVAEDWPSINAVFPRPDALGYYNLNKSFDNINTELSTWKTQDMVQKRLLSEGEEAHPGWSMINRLVKQGYMYQAACELATLKTDRIKKEDVNTGDASTTFINYDSAVMIFKALETKFGKDKDDKKVLKTKAFPMEVANLWGKLVATSGNKEATKQFLKFINTLDAKKVNEIKEAKSKKGEASKDEKRKSLLQQEFYQFIGREKIVID